MFSFADLCVHQVFISDVVSGPIAMVTCQLSPPPTKGISVDTGKDQAGFIQVTNPVMLHERGGGGWEGELSYLSSYFIVAVVVVPIITVGIIASPTQYPCQPTRSYFPWAHPHWQTLSHARRQWAGIRQPCNRQKLLL